MEKIEIKVTWRLFLYIILLITTMFFIGKAINEQYSPQLAGLTWLLYIFSNLFSIFLIRKEEVK